jgi:hypothetical protein
MNFTHQHRLVLAGDWMAMVILIPMGRNPVLVVIVCSL